MRTVIAWKTFAILVIACAIASMLVVPYQVALSPDLASYGAILYFNAFLQGLIIFSIATFLGLILSEKVGFDLPVLEGRHKMENFKEILMPSALWGLLAGALITLLALPFGSSSMELLAADSIVPVWARFLALFYGGIAEEVLMRLFAMSLFAWIFIKIKVPKKISIWIAIIISAVLFGLGHLPFTAGLTEITADVVARAVVLNGAGAVIFSLLYWRRGLESAIIAHFFAGIILRFISPQIALLIIYS